MNIQKKVTIAGTIFVLLAGATILSELLSVTGKKSATGLFFRDLDIAVISKVAIGDSATGVIMTKSSAGWMVSDRNGGKSYLADQIKAKTVLDKIKMMEKEQLVSENKSNHDALEVTDKKGISVSVYLGGSTAVHQFYIGKKSENFQLNNIRLAKENAVYLVSGSIRFAFVTSMSEWRDRAIFNQPEDSIVKVALGDGSVIEKIQGLGESYWVVRYAGQEVRANQDNVKSYLTSMSTLTCSDWADETMPDSLWKLDTVTFAVTFYMANGTSETITLGKKEESDRNRYYLKNSSKEDLYLVVSSGAEIPFASAAFMAAPPLQPQTAAPAPAGPSK